MPKVRRNADREAAFAAEAYLSGSNESMTQFLARQRDPANIQPFLDQYVSSPPSLSYLSSQFRDTLEMLMELSDCDGRKKV